MQMTPYYWPINLMQKYKQTTIYQVAWRLSWITCYFCSYYQWCMHSKQKWCVETPCSSASSVYHHANNNNNATSSIFASKLLPSKNFLFGIDWKSAPSVHHHGKVYNLNNCTNVVVNCKTQSYRKRIHIIYLYQIINFSCITKQ